MKKALSKIIATWFFSGLAPKAPGTFGTLLSLIFVIPVAYYGGFTGMFLFGIAVSIAGYWAIKELTKDLNEKDLSMIVVDETLGIIVTFIFVTPFLFHNMTYWWLYPLGFGLFRFFDICKMGLVKYYDDQNSEIGVILDDVFAGINSGLILYVVCNFMLQ